MKFCCCADHRNNAIPRTDNFCKRNRSTQHKQECSSFTSWGKKHERARHILRPASCPRCVLASLVIAGDQGDLVRCRSYNEEDFPHNTDRVATAR